MKQNLSRFLLTVLTPLLLIGLTSCQSPLTDVTEDAPFAKKDKGKPPPTVSATLEEYWVFPNPNPKIGGSLIHVAGAGTVVSVATGVVFDYFFNGARERQSPHFEYGYGGIGHTPITSSDGQWHIDILWNGERDGIGPYPDMLLTGGPDPFVFILDLVADEKTGWRGPITGIIYGGETVGPEARVDSEHGEQQPVTSYALFQGDPAPGVLYLEELTVNSATCAAVSTERGKKSARKQVRQVSVDVTIGFGAMEGSEIIIPTSSDNNPYAWVELHLRDVDSEYLSRRLVVGPIQAQVSGSFAMDLPLPDDESELDLHLELVVDYVNPIGQFADFAYDPAKNGVTTTVGFGGTPWVNGATTTLEVYDGNFPVGKIELLPVPCN